MTPKRKPPRRCGNCGRPVRFNDALKLEHTGPIKPGTQPCPGASWFGPYKGD